MAGGGGQHVFDRTLLAGAIKINNVGNFADQRFGTDGAQIGAIQIVSTRHQSVIFPKNLYDPVHNLALRIKTLVAEANNVSHLNLINRYWCDDNDRIPVEFGIHAVGGSNSQQATAGVLLSEVEGDLIGIGEGLRSECGFGG